MAEVCKVEFDKSARFQRYFKDKVAFGCALKRTVEKDETPRRNQCLISSLLIGCQSEKRETSEVGFTCMWQKEVV